MYRFLLTRAWIVRHVTVVVVCGLFILAAFWQIHRLHEREAYNATVRHAMAQPPVDLDRTPEAPPYRRVVATGRYDVSNELLLRARVRQDTSGNDLLTPLVLPDGHAVLVDRGWVSLDVTRPRTPRTAPRADRVRIEGLVLPPERKRIFSPDIPPTGKVDAVNYVNVERIGRQLPYPLSLDGYVLLAKQRPANKTPLYEAEPELDNGPHKGYAVQWILFTVVSIAGSGAFIRRSLETRGERGAQSHAQRKGPPA